MASETQLVKLTGWVDPSFAEVVKAEAKRQDRSVSWVVAAALKAWIENTDTRSKT